MIPFGLDKQSAVRGDSNKYTKIWKLWKHLIVRAPDVLPEELNSALAEISVSIFWAVKEGEAVAYAIGPDFDKTEAMLKAALATTTTPTPTNREFMFSLRAFGELLQQALPFIERLTQDEAPEEVKNAFAGLANVDASARVVSTVEFIDDAYAQTITIDNRVIIGIFESVIKPTIIAAREFQREFLTAFGGGIPVGEELPLYGKTVDGEDFDWESLRGKYVLVKFTATWCGPCRVEIPGMLEVYERYSGEDFEIVSVYIWERDNDSIKASVEAAELPWIIISEPLTQAAEMPAFSDTFPISGVPMMLLVDKEGKDTDFHKINQGHLREAVLLLSELRQPSTERASM